MYSSGVTQEKISLHLDILVNNNNTGKTIKKHLETIVWIDQKCNLIHMQILYF